VYVDGSAHTGEACRAFVESSLNVREAHLIKPNTKNFAQLRETAAMLQAGLGRIRLHNAALGSAPGQVRMTDADTLSRFVAVTGSGGTPAPETQASEIGLLVASA